MCHSRLPTPEKTFSLCASIRGNGGQVDPQGEILCFQDITSEGFLAFSRRSRGCFDLRHRLWPAADGEVGSLEMTSC